MKFTTHPVITIVLGVGIGILSTCAVRNIMNEKMIQSCYQKANHQLILTKDFFGETYFCIDVTYF